ncbi:isoprenyl transferase [Curvivirga sp.]|uniref:isoprenyl transferase n=1 Tax=Curvivirga sp. TaxID=2856848 RepID=UPI003B5AF0EC
MSDTQLSNCPTHVAIIMDGNGRWAKKRGLPRVAGHKKGAESVRKVIKASAELGVKFLTLYSFSSENWKRPEDEVSALMGLLGRYLKSEIVELHSNNIRFRVIGDRERLPENIQRLISDSERMTEQNSGMTLILALSYGARAEIAEAAKKIAKSAKLGLIQPDAIDEDVFAAHLSTAGIPDPDLVIRSSGEKRISNFLLWQLAYSEFYFTDTLWPNFDKKDLIEAFQEFNKRDRRYGAIASESK